MIKVIFFDFGRVLMMPADDGLYEANDRIFNLPSGRTGELINEFQSRGHLGEFTEMSEYWPKRTIDAGPVNFEQAQNFWQKVVSTRRANMELIDLIKKNLFKKFRLAVLSNFTPDLDEYLEKYKINHFFERVFISAVLRMKKPDPEIYRHALKEMNAVPQESLFIDDKEENVAVAENLGMRGIVFGETKKSINEIIKIIL